MRSRPGLPKLVELADIATTSQGRLTILGM
jgi:hypothetical protein